jgi:hypothetical protein
MPLENFYEILSGICFALTGLWWTVVEGRSEWRNNPRMRGLAGGVYASFLIPGVMSLGAQIGGENKLVWRAVFAVSALLGMYFTSRLLWQLRKAGQTGFLTRSRWAVVLIYASVALFGVFPELTAPTGLKPIQVEAFLLCIIVLTGHSLAWEMMTRKLN